MTDLFIYTTRAVDTSFAGWVILAVLTFRTEVVQKFSSLRFFREKNEKDEQGSEHEEQLVHLQGRMIRMKRLAECGRLLTLKTCGFAYLKLVLGCMKNAINNF